MRNYLSVKQIKVCERSTLVTRTNCHINVESIKIRDQHIAKTYVRDYPPTPFDECSGLGVSWTKSAIQRATDNKSIGRNSTAVIPHT